MNIEDIPAQFWSIVVATVITIVLIFFLYWIVKRQDPYKKPNKIVTVLEAYIIGFENLMLSVTGGRLKKGMPYLFALFNFILIMSFISLLGFQPAPSSWMFTFTLGFITFIGIYVVGIGTKGLIQFAKDKYRNPMELFSQFAPLLSISLRLFGATFATALLGELFIIIFTGLGQETLSVWWPVISIPWSWAWTLIDMFFSVVQAFVFVVLTALYWSLEHGPSWKVSERRSYYKAEKELKKQVKMEKKEQKQKQKI